jgi:hypothetical protein
MCYNVQALGPVAQLGEQAGQFQRICAAHAAAIAFA